MGNNPVSIVIGGDAEPLKQAAKEAQQALGGLAASVDKQLGTATQETTKRLSQFKEGIGRSRETAMFFTQALGEFGPQGRTAQIAISGLAGAIMGGGGVLMALTLAQTAARLLADAWQEDAKAAEEAAKKEAAAAKEREDAALRRMGIVRDATDSYRAQNRALRAELLGVSKEETAHREEVAKLKSEILMLSGAQRMSAERRLVEIERIFAENQQLQRNVELRKQAREEAAKNAKEREDLNALVSFGPQDSSFALAATANAAVVIGANQMMIASNLEVADSAAYIARGFRDAGAASLEMAATAGQALAQDFVGAFRPVLMQSAAFTRAMKAVGGTAEDTADLSGAAFAAMAQGALAALAQEAGVQAVMETARGVAALAAPMAAAARGETAAGHFAAAAAFAGVAGTAGAAAYAIGQNRGMTAAERAQVEAAQAGGGGGGGGGSYSSGSTSQTIQQTTIMVMPHPFISEADTLRAAQATIEKMGRLDMLRREA